MSSKQNDTNQIHLGNYEEFFILYMDNELTSEQMQMVDEFLASHPDLRGEFEILMSIKLPSEEFSINKDDLYAVSMKSISFINEDLLLYIDNELSSDKTKEIELELNSNKDYFLQHQLLLKTKLDASETITYPNKEDLYRRTERVVAFKLWMRVAAAIVLVAVLSFFYYKQSSVDSNNIIVKQGEKSSPANKTENNTVIDNPPIIPPQEEQNVAVNNTNIEKKTPIKSKDLDQREKKDQIQAQQLLANNNVNGEAKTNPDLEIFRKRANREMIPTDVATMPTVANKKTINKSDVTSPFNNRKTVEGAQEETVANKGSVKGFLRKATRLIEKRTGFDPTNENGELLLGVVAVKLK
ncbi:MAG: anti-sigma factor family protein [Flavisolibacter sp.]